MELTTPGPVAVVCSKTFQSAQRQNRNPYDHDPERAFASFREFHTLFQTGSAVAFIVINHRPDPRELEVLTPDPDTQIAGSLNGLLLRTGG